MESQEEGAPNQFLDFGGARVHGFGQSKDLAPGVPAKATSLEPCCVCLYSLEGAGTLIFCL